MASPSMSIKVEREADHDRLVFEGPITDTFAAIVGRIPKDLKPKLVLDLYGITTVNSFGVRDWVNMVKAVGAGRSLVFERCSPTFIASANVVLQMLGNAEIKSLNRGYNCVSNHYWWKEIDPKTVDMATVDRTRELCGKCGEKGTPEYGAEEMFQFLDYHKPGGA